MISLYTFENFLRFLLQDKHNASYFSNMTWRGTLQSKCKSNKKAAIITYLVVDLFACLNGIGGFYSFIPLPFRCGITGCRMLCRCFSNCSLNHSPMGRKSTVRMNLPMQHIRPVDYQYFINKMVEKSVLHFFLRWTSTKLAHFFGLWKQVKNFVQNHFWGADLRCILECMKYIASHIVRLPNVFLSPSFWLYFNGCIYE